MSYKRSFRHLFQEFDLSSARTRWQIRLTLGVSSAMLIASLLGIPRVMWIGIAAMSVLLPFRKDIAHVITLLLYIILSDLFSHSCDKHHGKLNLDKKILLRRFLPPQQSWFLSYPRHSILQISRPQFSHCMASLR